MARRSALLLACLLLLALPGAAYAQGNQGGGAGQQTRGGQRATTQEGEVGQPDAQIATVGAGTTDGTTTGVSGPEDPAQARGRNALPPLPEPGLCDPYQDSDAYGWCLSVVLRSEDVEIINQGESR